MVFISDKHNKQKEKGITIKIFKQGNPELKSKTITLQETSITQVYDELIKIYNKDKEEDKEVKQ